MLELDRYEELKTLGWELLLQVDEVILEGPRGTVEDGLELVLGARSTPFAGANRSGWS